MLKYGFNEAVEAVVQRYSAEKVFVEILQNSQENTCARVSFLIKSQAYEVSKNTFIIEHFRWLLPKLLRNFTEIAL